MKADWLFVIVHSSFSSSFSSGFCLQLIASLSTRAIPTVERTREIYVGITHDPLFALRQLITTIHKVSFVF